MDEGFGGGPRGARVTRGTCKRPISQTSLGFRPPGRNPPSPPCPWHNPKQGLAIPRCRPLCPPHLRTNLEVNLLKMLPEAPRRPWLFPEGEAGVTP